MIYDIFLIVSTQSSTKHIVRMDSMYPNWYMKLKSHKNVQLHSFTCCFNTETLVEFIQNGEQPWIHFSKCKKSTNQKKVSFTSTDLQKLTMYRDFEGVISCAMEKEIASYVKSNCANHLCHEQYRHWRIIKIQSEQQKEWAIWNQCNNKLRWCLIRLVIHFTSVKT